MKIDPKGRCCGRKPIHYKGRSFASPLNAPLLFCPRCNREYDVATGEQRPNWAYKKCPGCECWIAGSASACGECICEQEEA